MYRRSVVRALLGTGLLGALAGCNGLIDDARSSSASPTPDAASASSTPREKAASTTPDATAREPYRAAGAPLLDRPRAIHLRNLGSTSRFATLVLTAPDERREVHAASTEIPPGETVSFPALLETAGVYDVLVETADGTREQYDWTVVEPLDDLWVDFLPGVAFRRPVLCFADSPFVVADADRTVGYEVPTALGVGDALGSTPALAIDTHETAEKRATLKIWTGGQLRFASRFDFPPDVRALVPVLPATNRYDVLLRTDDGQAIYDWQPSVRNTLHASLTGEPSFRCGYAFHDVRVRNETTRAQSLTVRVLTGERTLFEQSFAVDAGEVSTAPAAVDPAGPLNFEILTDDGTERFNWVRCAPTGPIIVAVSENGVYVSVQPIGS